MGRQALLAVVCWLSISQTFGGKPKLSLAIQDNESAESAPRLYRNVPVGVYASGAPYAAYTFQLPTFAAAPQTAASQHAPTKENYVNHLTDSYGNKFVGTPQLATYKIAFPQQFVPLQQLPQHLAQPLVAASANFQFKQSNGQYFGAPFRVPANLQGPAPTPLNQFPTFGQLYGGEKVQSLAPTVVTHSQAFGNLNAQQQAAKIKEAFTNTQSHGKYGNLKNEPKPAQQKEPELIIGKPKVEGTHDVSHKNHGDPKFQKIQEAHSTHSEVKPHHKPQEFTNYESKFETIHDTPNIHQGDAKFQRLQEAPHSHHEKPKSAQHTSEGSHDDGKYHKGEINYESKFQPTHETPSVHHGDTKFKIVQEAPHSHHAKSQQETSYSEPKYQQFSELPHYETKFQIIQEPSDPPHFQRIQEHHAPHGEIKFQRLEEPRPAPSKHSYEIPQKQAQHSHQGEKSQNYKAKLQAAPAKQTITYINDINGKKTIVELDTKPKLPLLDLTLLEPLKFDKPIVPQVQHFLPRINQATYQKLPDLNVKNYQKEFMISKTSSYDSAEGQEKPQRDESKKKHKKPTHTNKYPKKSDVPKKTTVTYYDPLGDAPEITYEISSPNYKETIKQKAVSYNKETESEPVHYTYGSQTSKEPVTYSYSRTSKEPLQITSVEYEGNGPGQLVYKFKPEEGVHQEQPRHNSAPHHSESENDKESSHESDEDEPSHRHHNNEHYEERPKSSGEHYETSPQQKQNIEKPQEVVYSSPPKYHSEPVHFTSENINFQPILQEYQTNIRLLTTPSSSIKVDPHQHVHQPNDSPPPQSHANHQEERSQQQHHHPQHPAPAPQKHHHSSAEPQHHHHSSPEPQHHHHSSPESQHHHHSSPEPQHHHHSSPQSQHHHHSSPESESFNAPTAHIHEKSKKVIIHEETPDERHALREQMREEVVNQEENSEEDFEKAYQDAAIGFPAYSKRNTDNEKDIFDPESYGVPHDHVKYDFENTPFQQYQAEGDEFPKESRSSYKDARDKMMQNYYSDYSISKPESLLDRYQNKLGYYKLFKEQKPDYLADTEENDKKQKSAKFTVAPAFDFGSQDKEKSYYGYSKPKQQPLYEYDYSNGPPRDSSAYASRPYQSYKRSRMSFVEPQFHYGFAPAKLLDSELAAMASNDSPESEKPGMRKKVYKENWYIKKTKTSAAS